MSVNERRLNFLLVMPRLVQNIGDGYSFPLGIAYVSSSMKKAGFNVVTLNLNHREGDVFEVLNRVIDENRIDVVATGGLSFQYNTIRSVVESAKRVGRDIVTVVGGGIINGDPEAAMAALEYADFGVIGEGEITLCELGRTLEGGGDILAVDGLICKEGTSYRKTGKRREIDDLDSLPWPDYEGFDVEKYLNAPPSGISGLNEKHVVFMLGSRSCPYNCTFCFHTVGRKYRQRSLDSIFAELDYLVSRYGVGFVCMADELFARKKERVREFCRGMKKYNLRWWAQFRVDDVDEELIAILKEGNCATMSFGLESADNRILKSMRKGTTVEQIERALKLVYDAGISLDGCFIFGDIEETVETANNTLKWWREHAEYKINLNLITVFPGSYLYQHACRQGIIQDRARFLKEGCPQINISRLTEREMSELVRYLMEAHVSLVKTLEGIEVLAVEPATGRVTLAAACSLCGRRNVWENIKLFAANFIPCAHCGQKYNIPLPAELRTNLEENMAGLLRQFGKVAVWGVNYHTSDLFKHSRVLHDPKVFPVDISGTKRLMDLHGKRIHPPTVIEDEGIKAVVIAIPAYVSQISSQVRNDHRNVSEIVDICRLIERESYVFSGGSQ